LEERKKYNLKLTPEIIQALSGHGPFRERLSKHGIIKEDKHQTTSSSSVKFTKNSLDNSKTKPGVSSGAMKNKWLAF
jgi:hypothetical protein